MNLGGKKTKTAVEAPQESGARPQTMKGTVVKTAMKDTITVAVSRFVKHPKYKKYQTRTKKYLVHAPDYTVAVGDAVTITACRPISKLKRFKLA